MGLWTLACTLSCLGLWSSEQCLPLSRFLLAHTHLFLVLLTYVRPFYAIFVIGTLRW